MELAKLAMEVGLHPLYEIFDGTEYKMSGPSRRLKELRPLDDYWKTQGQFKHLFKPEWADFKKKLQEQVNDDWEILKKKCGIE
jgi:pyruvate ferredoxin oxidoreductase beta subunit